jgi:hypothetical protein
MEATFGYDGAAGGGWWRRGRVAEVEAAVRGGDYGSSSPFPVSV